jgi:hypothetical protein
VGCRHPLAALALAATAGAVAWALSGLPGMPAPCPAAGCDCEAAGAGPIRQPANAWSSLALVAAGIALLLMPSPAAAGEVSRLPGSRDGGGSPTTPVAGEVSRLPGRADEGRSRPERPRRAAVLLETVPAAALALAGIAAFLFHAGLTAWGARLDGIAVGVLAAALSLEAWRPRRRRFLLPALPAALGGLCWALGRSGGPWCRPDTVLQGHAAWHGLMALTLFLWLRNGRRAVSTSRIPPRPLPSRREDPRP